MSTLRHRHLPKQVPEPTTFPEQNPQRMTNGQESNFNASSVQQNTQQDPFSSLINTMPNGENLSRTLQQVSQMQNLVSNMQSGDRSGLMNLLPLLMSNQENGNNASMMQMLPLMMQWMQQRNSSTEENHTTQTSNISQLSSLLSLLQAK